MVSRITLVLILARVSLGIQLPYPVGSEVRVTLRTGMEYSGEILALRDSTIVFSLIHGAKSDVLAQAKGAIRILHHDSIHEISLPGTGTSRILLGLLLGLPTGGLIGYTVGKAEEVEQRSDDTFGCHAIAQKHDNAIRGGFIGCLAGGLVGAALGNALSGKEVMIISPTIRDFSGLKILARYKDEEPAFLREVNSILAE